MALPLKDTLGAHVPLSSRTPYNRSMMAPGTAGQGVAGQDVGSGVVFGLQVGSPLIGIIKQLSSFGHQAWTSTLCS